MALVVADPPRLQVSSRHLVNGSTLVLLHVNDNAVVEGASATVKIQATSFKFGQMPIATLVDDGGPGLRWEPKVAIPLEVGDELVVTDASWFASVLRSGHELTVRRPSVDNRPAPKPSCTPSSYATNPAEHMWC
jgi:hypothetical protein